MRKILIIVAHQDDEVLSCGGLIHKSVKHEDEVRVLTLFGRKYNYGRGPQYAREQDKDFLNASLVLGYSGHRWMSFEEGEPYKVGYYDLLHVVEKELAQFQPQVVVVPSEHDLNQDHRHLADVCRIALRPANLGDVKLILACHGIDGHLHPSINWYVRLTADEAQRKVKAMECYKREVRLDPHPRSFGNLWAQMRMVGAQCGAQFAEPYTLLLCKD